MVLTLTGLVVIGLEFVALEAGSNAVGGGNDPLQEGVRSVVGARGIDRGVGRIAVSRRRERLPVLAQVGEMSGGLKLVPGHSSVGGVHVRVVALVPERAIQRLVRVKLTAMLEPRSFGEFSKVVQQRSKRNTCCLVG